MKRAIPKGVALWLCLPCNAQPPLGRAMQCHASHGTEFPLSPSPARVLDSVTAERFSTVHVLLGVAGFG
jgi:hypothetical protein